MRDRAIVLVDKKSNGVSLRDFLAERSITFPEIPLFDKNDAIANATALKSVEYIFSTWNMPTFSVEEVSNLFPSLRAIFYAAGETKYFSDAFHEQSVKIFNAQTENSRPVAEFVLAQILLANKGYFSAQATYRRGPWYLAFKKARRISQECAGNKGSTVGIIGFGAVGSILASLLEPFDMQLLVHDPFVDENKIHSAGGIGVSLEELFKSSDVITNHLPDNAATRNILSYTLFSTMKATATFINTGRGRQVDEKGLVRALREQCSRSALLDVTHREPPPFWSPLYRQKNIYISPHIAGSQGGEIHRLYEAAYRQYLVFSTDDQHSRDTSGRT